MSGRSPILANEMQPSPERRYGALGDEEHPRTDGRQAEPEGTALYARNVDRKSVTRSRRLFLFGAFLTFVFAVVTLCGGIYSYSLALIVNSTSYLAVFSRLMFVGYLLQSAGRPASRLAHFRQHKPELRLSLVLMLVAWLLMGGCIFLVTHNLIKENIGVESKLGFLITAGAGFVFALILLCVIQMAQHRAKAATADDANTPNDRGHDNEMTARKKQAPGPITENMSEFNRERGLLLRRTLKHVPMRPYTFLTFWFVLQCVVALGVALLFWFMPDKYPWADMLAAVFFMPLTFISTCTLMYDVIDLLTEGILQGIDFSEMAESLLSIDGVAGVRHLRVWALTMDRVSLSVLLSIDSAADVDTVLNRASALLKAKYDIFEYNVDTDRSAALLASPAKPPPVAATIYRMPRPY